MKGFVVKRLILVIPTIFLISLLSFVLVYRSPESVAQAILENKSGVMAISEEMIADLIIKEGLDRPVYEAYLDWAGQALVGNFGQSLLTKQPILPLVLEAAKKTLITALIALVCMLGLGLPIGLYSGYREGGLVDRFGILLGIVTMSTPPYWLGLMVLYLFAGKFKWSFVVGYNGWASLLTLGLILGLISAGGLIRIIRNKTVLVLQELYVEQAVSQGMPTGRIFFGHVLPNVLPPVISVLCMQVVGLIGGAAILEQIFSIPGLGNLMIKALNGKDLPLLSTIVLYLGAFIALLNFFQDVGATYIDRRNLSKSYVT